MTTRTYTYYARILLLFIFIIISFYTVVQYIHTTSPNTSPEVTVSAYPLYELTRMVAGDVISVALITPQMQEPHEYEVTAKDIQTITGSKLFIYSGSILESWAPRILAILDNSTTTSLPLLDESNALTGHHNHNEEKHGDATEEDERILDPHFWISPLRARDTIPRIRDALIAVDPLHANDYANNARAAIETLSKIDTDYRTTFAECADTSIVVSHDAFAYLAHDYDITITAISGLSPEEEPTSQELIALITTIQTTGVTHIFTEAYAPTSRYAETLSTETGVVLETLATLEMLPVYETESGADYVSVLYANLAKLKQVLQCGI